ncbi:phosphodiesterase [Roseospirillum parvum]|uniref:3',5'-cyclic AMP phosphodiesterase CpdA n=1 Tax=Roseospirillum parvum TaxID=83401 RepID=A0A1G7V926_9PROT|nr:phosphodiesterase [Roseospirillum parvum]SDG56273.1 3',5'-cyclic AMP phosphodiesterase CpdA [Roseospirillum parvum]
MRIAQITDTHVTTPGTLAFGCVDTLALLAATVDHANRISPGLDAVVLTGDLTDMGRSEEYTALKPLLDRLAAPYFLLPGNHDDRDALRQAFDGHPGLAPPGPFMNLVVDHFPVRLIGLDTLLPGRHEGHLCPARLSWLEARLSEAPQRPTMVFMHHPPFATGIAHMDEMMLLRPGDLLAVLRRHPQVRHVAAGHVHRAVSTAVDGLAMSIAPSSAHAVSLDLDPDAPATFTLEPPALRVFDVSPAGQVVSHLSPVGVFDGPHLF